MQDLHLFPNDVVCLDLTPLPQTASSSGGGGGGGLSIDEEETAEERIQRLISEHPVIIFSGLSCCMCHVMKKLLATIGVCPTVIELDDGEISALSGVSSAAPAVFIGGDCVGGLESLVALHLSGHLVPKLVEVGALWVQS
ncbi:PREDICTED: glutaredoxin-C6 [Tarenaya hassleriana]|uniref:glutaredoxin-C6 n=1 Tax=Tarenaya hassleriana TaxID=28532 RepID=UPI00053C0B07|nr:PREDICTED: glutaredoxin-C6 [Tarenaya hassleriana]